MAILKKHSRAWVLLYLLFSTVTVMPLKAFSAYEEQPEWQQYFDKYDAKGTIVILDGRDAVPKAMVLDSLRAHKRYSPASTFKIPHSLFALDSNLVNDEFRVFKWDGIERGFSPHNQDQNLRSAMRNSAVWVYDDFAKQLGEQKAQHYLSLIDYGNADPTVDYSSINGGSYWIEGKLAISAVEQVEFLQKLYRHQLPFELADQLLVKDIMINEASNEWILRAKTGWQGQYGWWVGWVEWPTGAVFFALNIDTPNRMKDLYKREAIARDILQSIAALPTER